jgi:hypothetical protein
VEFAVAPVVEYCAQEEVGPPRGTCAIVSRPEGGSDGSGGESPSGIISLSEGVAGNGVVEFGVAPRVKCCAQKELGAPWGVFAIVSRPEGGSDGDGSPSGIISLSEDDGCGDRAGGVGGLLMTAMGWCF